MSVIDKTAKIGFAELDAELALDLPTPHPIGIPLEGLGAWAELLKKLGGLVWFCDVGEA